MMAHVIALKSHALAGRKNGLFARLQGILANYCEYRRVYEELDSLSEQDLTDLGISRYDIRRIAKEAAYGR